MGPGSTRATPATGGGGERLFCHKSRDGETEPSRALRELRQRCGEVCPYIFLGLYSPLSRRVRHLKYTDGTVLKRSSGKRAHHPDGEYLTVGSSQGADLVNDKIDPIPIACVVVDRPETAATKP